MRVFLHRKDVSLMGNTMEPIRRKEDIDRVIDYFIDKGDTRGRMIFFLGTNVFLRISDLMKLKRSNFSHGYIETIESKTDKRKRQKLHPVVWYELVNYFEEMEIGPDDYLFTSKKMKYKPLSRTSAWQIIKEASEELGLHNIGTHSLRKTYGYHYFKQTKDLETLRKLFNHSSQHVTAIYIGITQEDLDKATSGFAVGLR